jgi:predicted amidohydrolase YtcJ
MARSEQVVLHGKVLPLSDGLKTQQAVGIRDGKILGVGGVSQVADMMKGVAALDFGDRTIMPGFIDSHSHAASSAMGAAWMIDCVNTCSCIEEMQQVLTQNLDAAERTGWVNARGTFMANVRWTDGRYPTREDLDKVSKKVPIAVRTGHISILSTKALEVVEIEKYANAVHGSGGPIAIHRGADGKPNGRINNLDGLLPYPEPDDATVESSLDTGIRDYFTAHGVTTICEITDHRRSLGILGRLIDQGRVRSRFKLLLRVPRTCSFEDALRWRELGITERPGMFEVAGVKLFADGGFSSADAAVKAAYAKEVALHPGSKGVLSFKDDELARILEKSATAGMQVAFHANGERSQEQICRIVKELGLKGAAPVRLEHAGNWVWDPETPHQWQEAGALPVPNPMFLSLMAPAMPGFLGKYGAQHGRLPFKSLLARGWELPSGSDATCYYDRSVSNPFFSIWCCMKRQGWDGHLIDPEEAIGLEDALKMHTVHPARLLGEEHTRGTLEVNKLADLIVLDRNVLDVTADDVRDVNVDFVFRGGELVYAREGAAKYTNRPAAPAR